MSRKRKLVPCKNCGSVPIKPEDVEIWRNDKTCPFCYTSWDTVTPLASWKKNMLPVAKSVLPASWTGGYPPAAEWTGTSSWLCAHKDAMPIDGVGTVVFGVSHRNSVLKDIAALNVTRMICLSNAWTEMADVAMTPRLSHELPPGLLKITHTPEFVFLPCPDRDIPYNLRAMIYLVKWAIETARESFKEGTNIGVACQGGHGRTGLFLGALVIATGLCKTGSQAINHVRSAYCESAIEGKKQETLLDLLASENVFAAEDAKLPGLLKDIQKAVKDIKPPIINYTSYSYGGLKGKGVAPKSVRIRDIAKKSGVPLSLANCSGMILSVVGWGGNGVRVKLPDGMTSETGQKDIEAFMGEYDVAEAADGPTENENTFGIYGSGES